ncbi:MAG: hypothetical protein CMB80_00180 [Flammeovirgaceae bacterium]|nr:hypothetical protein [Flammeovirgaceae bacterium]|tara:strand:+ start:1186 stop:1473 length:288 start_codon:yes stop_codon:yes gene_type:complete
MSGKTNGERLAAIEINVGNLTDICMDHRMRQKELERVLQDTREDVAYMKGKIEDILELASPLDHWWKEHKGKITTGSVAAAIVAAAAIVNQLGLA